ncbi:hypothetical protein ATCC90586_004148 [Pythium insidiosum]|nr:hypothetical protein ATCC90586_004148 [Pythium insidiosum]
MPLLSFEGVEVDIPTTLQGIQFTFTNGALSIQCHGFTGSIVLSKPTSAMSLGDFPADASTSAVVQSTQSSPLFASPTPSKKRSTPGDGMSNEGVEDSNSDLLRKRIRPNFLNDVEQTMLLAQLDASQPSQRDPVAELPAAKETTPVKSAPSTAENKTPTKTPTPSKGKKNTANHKKGFFSPEQKELATKKPTAESATKRSRPAKAKAEPATQPSIRDMMMQATPLVTPAAATSSATPSGAKTSSIASSSIQWSSLSVSGSIPAERWGHTVTPISGGRVVVYGGADDDEMTLGDLHVFDVQKSEWSKPLNCESIPRAWHDAVFLADKNLMLVFGGERSMGDDQNDVLSDIMVLDTECFLWYPPAISGVPPAARSGHSCTVVGNDVVIFGGSRGRSRQSSVHVLDSEAWHWKTVKVEGKPPSARTYHSAVAVGDSVVYFGGNDSKKSFNSVHVLRKSTTTPDVWVWFHPCVVGAPPRARTGHSATVVDNSKILIFGGWDPQSGGDGVTEVFDDAFLLNTETWEWEAVALNESAETSCTSSGDVSATQPSLSRRRGRVGHCAVMADNSVLLIGGQNASEERLSAIDVLTFPSASSQSTSTGSPTSIASPAELTVAL